MDKKFKTFQIIPSVRRLGDFDQALSGEREVILLTGADIANLPLLVKKVHSVGKKAFVNLELLGGFGRDQTGLRLLKNFYKVDGVFSTDSARIGMARHLGLYTIQRFLISDSRAFDTSLKILKSGRSDAVEILPAKIGIDIISAMRQLTDIPILAGGFIRTDEDIEALKKAGFKGVTVSKKRFF